MFILWLMICSVKLVTSEISTKKSFAEKMRQNIFVDIIIVNVAIFNCKRFPTVTIIFREKIIKPRKEKALRLEKKKRSFKQPYAYYVLNVWKTTVSLHHFVYSRKKMLFQCYLDARNLPCYFWPNGTCRFYILGGLCFVLFHVPGSHCS